MIDWITAVVPCVGADALKGDQVICITGDGELKWRSDARVTVEGSFSNKVQVKATGRDKLWVSGNPAKFLQGHNLFGSNDLISLTNLFLSAVISAIGLETSQHDRDRWAAGKYKLKRVDVAESFRLPSTLDVDNWIRSAAPLVRGKHQGVSQYGGATIYVGQRSRRISLKLYNKAREVRKHKLPEDISHRKELLEYSEGLLRVEVRLLSLELKRRRLDYGGDWRPSKCLDLIKERIGRLEMPKKLRLTAAETSSLPPRLIGAVKCWESGQDLRTVYPRATYYRYRRELIAFGIDVSIPPKTSTNVVPLISYLTAEHQAEPPSWAVGTPLLACA